MSGILFIAIILVFFYILDMPRRDRKEAEQLQYEWKIYEQYLENLKINK